jgi:ribosome-associated protein
MEKFTLREGEEYIELNNLLKTLSWVVTGGEAKIRIDQGEVTVNGETEEKLGLAKNRQTYQVLTTYADPMTFVGELKAYYQDKINKLRRRTRTA